MRPALALALALTTLACTRDAVDPDTSSSATDTAPATGTDADEPTAATADVSTTAPTTSADTSTGGSSGDLRPTSTGDTTTGDTTTGDCISCREAGQGDNPAPLCPESQILEDAVTACICAECADECASVCTMDGEPTALCNPCAMAAASGPCADELDACLADV